MPRLPSVILLVASLLASCGGGGGYAGVSPFPSTPASPSAPNPPAANPPASAPSPAPTASLTDAAGLWRGTTDSNRNFAGLVLSDGTYYFIYSVPGAPSLIGGVTQGNVTLSGSTLRSTNARDFNLEGLGLSAGSVTAIAIAKTSLTGTISYTGGTIVQFTSAYDASFELKPTLAELAGSYAGQAVSSIGVQAAQVVIAPAGDFSGTVAGCRFTGTAIPRIDANAFNISVNFAGPPCLFVNQTLTGLAYYDASTRQLIALAPNQARTDGFLAVATKN